MDERGRLDLMGARTYSVVGDLVSFGFGPGQVFAKFLQILGWLEEEKLTYTWAGSQGPRGLREIWGHGAGRRLRRVGGRGEECERRTVNRFWRGHVGMRMRSSCGFQHPTKLSLV